MDNVLLKNVRLYVRDTTREDGSTFSSYFTRVSRKDKDSETPKVLFIPVFLAKGVKVAFKASKDGKSSAYADINLEGNLTLQTQKDGSVRLAIFVNSFTYYKEEKESGVKTKERMTFLIDRGYSGEELELMDDESFKKAFKEAYYRSL